VIIKRSSGFGRYPNCVCKKAFGGNWISSTVSDYAKVRKRFFAARIDCRSLCEKLPRGIAIAALKCRATLSNQCRRPIALQERISLGQHDVRD
jgi:hypothetical protein